MLLNVIRSGSGFKSQSGIVKKEFSSKHSKKNKPKKNKKILLSQLNNYNSLGLTTFHTVYPKTKNDKYIHPSPMGIGSPIGSSPGLVPPEFGL